MISIRSDKAASSADHTHEMKSTDPEAGSKGDGKIMLAPQEPIHPRVLYRFLKLDDDDIAVDTRESDKPISIGKSTATESLTSQTILEVRTTLRQRYKETEVVLRIHSTHLANMLRDVIKYWPGLSLISTETKALEFPKPYKPLVIYRKEIENYKTNHPMSHSQCYINQCNDHIDVLLDFLDQAIGNEVREEKSLHLNSPPMATFRNLWMLFRPGQIAYIHSTDDEPARPILVAESRLWEVPHYHFSATPMQSRGDSYEEVSGWYVENDGAFFKPTFASAAIEAFEGERQISSLPVYPKEFHENHQFEEYLEQRGKQYWEFSQPTYTHYDGALLEYKKMVPGFSDRWRTVRDSGVRLTSTVNDRVVLDFRSWHENIPKDPKSHTYPGPISGHWGQVPSARGCECEICLKTHPIARKSPLFYAIDVRDASKSDYSHLYALCDFILRGFILRENRWAMFHIDWVKRIDFKKDPFQHLILPIHIKDTITSIVWNYGQTSGNLSSWSPDFVKSKGEGQIFLLHGTPGVGKTCTAECVADYMQKPLLPISCADVGISTEDVQKNISRYFQLGKKWGAVVLIDEADVYLEQRSPEQLERNSLVSVFLRELEYFQGLLFITTNRVGTFDDAFISRIHVALYYPPLTDNDREKIWKTNFKRLESESKIEVAKATRHLVEDNNELRLARWNGREIRNAVQTALALAKKEAYDEGNSVVILQPDHISRVVNISRSFKKYLDAVHENDEEGRAKQREARDDNFTTNEK